MIDAPHLFGIAPLTLVGAAAMTFGAAYVRGLTGFGMAIILVPLLGILIPPGEAVVMGILLQLLIGPVGIGHILADADRETALPIGLAAMATTPIGMYVLDLTPADIARLLITLAAVGALSRSCCRKSPKATVPGGSPSPERVSRRASSPALPRCPGRRSCPSTSAAASTRKWRARRC